jgi:uncharacterized protein YxeA
MEGNKNMKKIIKAGICVAVAAVIATGCGNKNQNTESSSAAVEETVSATTETETKSGRASRRGERNSWRLQEPDFLREGRGSN